MESRTVIDSKFLLVIERGRSRFPQRPIDGERFLIGGGSNCHLQLGGQIPLLHSIILNDAGRLWIDAVVSEPPLVVNGQQVREVELNPGDVIEIDSFIFSVELRDSALPAADEVPVSDPALEYLQYLSNELESLERIAAGKQQGMQALVAAIARLQAAAGSKFTESTRTSPAVSVAEEAVPQADITTQIEEMSLSQLELIEQQELAAELSQDLPDGGNESSLRKTA